MNEVSALSAIELTLSELPLKTLGRITGIGPCEMLADRLKSLGLCEGRTVRLIKHGEPCIVSVYGSQLGLARDVANQIRVVPETV